MSFFCFHVPLVAIDEELHLFLVALWCGTPSSASSVWLTTNGVGPARGCAEDCLGEVGGGAWVVPFDRLYGPPMDSGVAHNERGGGRRLSRRVGSCWLCGSTRPSEDSRSAHHERGRAGGVGCAEDGRVTDPPLREDGTGPAWGWWRGRGRLETGPYAGGTHFGGVWCWGMSWERFWMPWMRAWKLGERLRWRDRCWARRRATSVFWNRGTSWRTAVEGLTTVSGLRKRARLPIPRRLSIP